MAPEQYNPSGEHDQRTDIWALGVILYQILAKDLPFCEKDDEREAICFKSHTPLRSHNAEIPHELEGICNQALEKEKEDRYSNVASMIHKPIGTPSYMPIELAAGRGEEIGPWTDVYLLGGILYEIVMRKPPHSGTNLYQVLSTILEGKPPEFATGVSQELRQICCTALTKNTKERHQRVEGFREAIQDFLHHRESLIISEKAEKKLVPCPF